MRDKFTIGVLLYGDYPELAERCLRSIANTIEKDHLNNLRIGMNQVSPQVADWVRSFVPEDCIWESDTNVHKYPMMRQLVHGIKPVETPYFMWFDDDSYLVGHQLTEQSRQPYWLQSVEHAMVNSDMIGAIYSLGWTGNQREWVKAQPWYRGKDPAERENLRFATGGWWTARTEILYRWDYPFSDLDHRGGDTMLGELCLQTGLRLNNFRNGVRINADAAGRESKAEKRGFDQPPCGAKFEPGVAAVLHRATGGPAPDIQKPTTPRRPSIIEL